MTRATLPDSGHRGPAWIGAAGLVLLLLALGACRSDDDAPSGSPPSTTAGSGTSVPVPPDETAPSTVSGEVSGALVDGRSWTVTVEDRCRTPELGSECFCTTIGGTFVGCDVPTDRVGLAAVDVAPDVSESESGSLAFGPLPDDAVTVRLRHRDGRLVDQEPVIDDSGSFWAMEVTFGDNPDEVVYLDGSGDEQSVRPLFER